MKKALSILLAAIFIASVLTSCASLERRPALDPRITLTSSDASDAAAWLDGRLDEIPDRVVLGTNADGYGVDLAALEADGYVVRVLGDEVALLARTAEGLDRAVRKYARSVEAGEAIADETYHEGYRVEELRFAGVDASEYAIAVECLSGYFTKWVTSNAAEPFAALIKTACGAKIAVGGEAKRKIVFRQIEDDGFKESSYHYYFAGGDLIFEFAELGGARNVFVKFLENELGWVDLMYGRDELREADFIDVPAATDVLCHPRFDGIRLTGFSAFTAENSLGRVNSGAFIYKYRIESAHHYLGTVWAREYGWFQTHHYPCLTSDDVLETVIEEVEEYVDGRIAGGAVIGEDLVAVNMGTQDEDRSWCSCKNCMKIYKEEGSWSGPLIYFLNRFDEAMDGEGYDGLKYPTFGYVGSNCPPRTIVPNDDIYITFVYNNSCTHHCVDGSQCTTDRTNPNYADYIRGWVELTPNVYVRPAPLSAPIHACTIIDQVYDDVKWLGEVGVKCIYNEIYTWKEFDTNNIAAELWEAMTFDPDMSRAEYYEEVGRLFEKYYGPEWRHVLKYVSLLEQTENATGRCWSIWSLGYLDIFDVNQYDFPTYRALWDEMIAELEAARYGADSKAAQDRVTRLLVAAIYEGCFASYYTAYEDYDDERIALLEERWAYMIECAKDCGAYVTIHGLGVLDSLEETAWDGGWTYDYLGKKVNLRFDIIVVKEGRAIERPVPEKYAAKTEN